MNEEIKKIENYVAEIIKMEDSFDQSMFGRFAESLVEEYATQRSLKLFEFFDNIMENQKEAVGSYGDADVTITKLKVNNPPEENSMLKWKVTYSAIQLIVECNDYAFFVISKLKEREGSATRNLYVYYCPQERVESIDLSKFVKKSYANGLSFQVKVQFYGEEHPYPETIRFHDFPTNTFYHFKEVYKELRSISMYGFDEEE